VYLQGSKYLGRLSKVPHSGKLNLRVWGPKQRGVESSKGNNLESQGETILKRKKGKRTGTPGKRLERERRETTWKDGGKQLMPRAGKRPGCRGKQSE